MRRLFLWFRAVRAYSFSASLVPVAVGGLLARETGADFSRGRFVVALVSGLFMHIAANLWNDYFDFKNRVDTAGGGVGSGLLVSGELLPAQYFRAAVLSAACALAGGIWLAVQIGWGLLVLGLAGLAGAVLYSAGPRSPKHRAFGEVWLFLSMGMGLTLGGWMAQTGRWSWAPLAAGTPAALLMVLILYTNNLRDMQTDREAGLRTLPMLFHATEARVIGLLLLTLPYLLTGFMAGARHLPPAVQLVYLTLPLAVFRGVRFWKGAADDSLVIGMAQLHLLFGLLFAGGLWYGH